MESINTILLRHYKHPGHKGDLASPHATFQIDNKKCGDRLSFKIHIHNNTLQKIRFTGEGCFYCLASASVACHFLTGKKLIHIKKEIMAVRNWLYDTEAPCPEDDDVKALEEIKNYPMRIACVDLSWKALKRLMEKLQV